MQVIRGIEQQFFAFKLDEADNAPIAFAVQLYRGVADNVSKGDDREFRSTASQIGAQAHIDEFIERIKDGEQYLLNEYEVALAYAGLRYMWGYQKFLSNPFRNFSKGATEIGLTPDELVEYSLVARDIIEILEPEVRRDVLPAFAKPTDQNTEQC